LLAEREHWYKEEDKMNAEDHHLTVNFKVCGGLDDLRSEIHNESIDTFLWETFMLKHFVDQGELKQVGDILTPWPCFMIAVRHEIIERNPAGIEKLFDTITECTKLFYDQKQAALDFISRACHLKMEDAEKWYCTVKFASNTRHISKKVLQETKDILLRAKVLSNDLSVEQIYNSDFAQINE